MSVPSRNIFWADIEENKPEIELINNLFVYYKNGIPYAVVYWEGKDAKEVQRWLAQNSFSRCNHSDCAIRVYKQGGYCGTHVE